MLQSSLSYPSGKFLPIMLLPILLLTQSIFNNNNIISISLHFLCTHLSLSLSLHVSSAPCCCYASMCSLFNSQLELFTFNFLLSIFTAFKLSVEYTIMHPSFSLYLSATVFSSIYLYFPFFSSSNFNYATYTVRIYNYRKVAIVRTHNLFLYYFCAYIARVINM